jgi:hypothetical protein
MRVRCLSFHASYACENTGVCCSSGWQVAVEERIDVTLAPRLLEAAGRLPNGPGGFEPMAEPPAGCKSTLRRHASGTCWFRDEAGRRCSIHREFGEASLPSACRHFPRVCVLEPAQVSVSLTHYCPTAAALLFAPSAPLELVDSPKAFPADWPFEGLDVRTAYPPLLRPGVLLGLDGLRALEDSAVSTLAEPGVLEQLARIRSALAVISTWTPANGTLPDYVRHTFGRAAPGLGHKSADPRQILRTSVPGGAPVPELPGLAARTLKFSTEADLALRRYLAARLVAGWIVYQAEGVETIGRYLSLCLDTVLLFETVRDPAEPDISRWKESIRNADLWLMHHCDPALLAANLG